MGLNPCSNGICSSSTDRGYFYYDNIEVLILVLMEYALREGYVKETPIRK